MKNDQMASLMKKKGYARSEQPFLRGSSTKLPIKKLWIALKQDHNIRYDPDTKNIVLCFQSKQGWYDRRQTDLLNYSRDGAYTFPVWMMKEADLKDRRWSYIGLYKLGRRWKERHTVVRRNELHETDMCRIAEHVGDDLPDVNDDE